MLIYVIDELSLNLLIYLNSCLLIVISITTLMANICILYSQIPQMCAISEMLLISENSSRTPPMPNELYS